MSAITAEYKWSCRSSTTEISGDGKLIVTNSIYLLSEQHVVRKIQDCLLLYYPPYKCHLTELKITPQLASSSK